MNEIPHAPRSGSIARTWLRILAWAIPGVTAPAVFLGAMLLAYGGSLPEAVPVIGFFATLVALIIGCAFFDNLLHLPRPLADGIAADPARKFKGKRFAFFIVMQAVLTPVIGFATGSACTAIVSL